MESVINTENTSDDENILLSQLKNGDEEAFTTIYKQYWDKLYFLAHKHLKSSVAAEEIVQEVFLSLWNKKHRLNIESLSLYLAAMARFAVYRHLANIKRQTENEKQSVSQTAQVVSLEDEIESKHLLEVIGKLSNTLPEKCRLVFIYNKLLDQPLNKVAEQLNISQKTAEAHLTKALKSIRSNFGEVLSLLFIL